MLLLDHEQLPWSRWGEQFAAAMPDQLRRLQETAASADGIPRREAIRNRVSSILPLYQLSRYRPPAQPPRQSSTPPPANDRDQSPASRPVAEPTAPSRAPTTDPHKTTTDAEPSRDLASDKPLGHDENDQDRAEAIVNLPDVAWISARDGTRAAGDLEDQAARYHAPRHELTINADFRAITDLITHWRGRYHGVPGARAVIEAQVHEWCEQVLVEVVLAARNTRWNDGQLDTLLSPSSFSAALLPRHLLHAMLQKRLAQKLGSPRTGTSR